MFAVIRHYHFDPKRNRPKNPREFCASYPKEGFVRYYWFDSGKGEGASQGAITHPRC
jgi:hypothetical protein